MHDSSFSSKFVEVKDWTSDRCIQWLTTEGMTSLIPLFLSRSINGEKLVSLDSSKMKVRIVTSIGSRWLWSLSSRRWESNPVKIEIYWRRNWKNWNMRISIKFVNGFFLNQHPRPIDPRLKEADFVRRVWLNSEIDAFSAVSVMQRANDLSVDFRCFSLYNANGSVLRESLSLLIISVNNRYLTCSLNILLVSVISFLVFA